ncbi:MAG: hypothetical protein HGA31_00010 [Candidatus Moranbacteria bacterium]|nr:hypothetical protein [Candidatus Moranbacteria bacterium]
MSFIPSVLAAGVIDDAPSLQTVFMRALQVTLSLFGVVALVALIASGFMYFFSGGDEARAEQAKKMMAYSTLGLFLVLVSLVAVRQLTVMV